MNAFQTLALLVQSLRPTQWVKNLFVFAPILFSQNFFDLSLLSRVMAAFAILCLLSGSVYILNDLVDRQQDKLHPVKRNRPLASGRLKTGYAQATFVSLVPLCLVLSFALHVNFLWVVLCYLALQISYTFYLKHIVILDVLVIALGFVLRVAAGGVVIGVEISSWLLVCTILISLFLALSKRRHECVILEQNADKHRKVLGKYSPYLLDQMISVVTASTVIAYALYTMSEETIDRIGGNGMVFTIPFVLYGIFRYLYIVHEKGGYGNPESIVISDKPLLLDILLWMIVVGVILYG